MTRDRIAVIGLVAGALAVGMVSPAAASGSVSAAPPAPSASVQRVGPGSGIVPISRAEARQRPVLRVGSRGLWVRRLHRALGIRPAAQPFGAQTAAAVRRFRLSVGLPARARVGSGAWRRLGSLIVAGRGRPDAAGVPSSRPILRRGDSSTWVSALQAALGVQPNTGYFGPITFRAVKDFQAANGLPVTGVVDQATWRALGARVVPPKVDVTTTEAARTSRRHRKTLGVAAFVDSPTARRVVQRESGGQCDIRSPGGTYRGKWQMDASFWSTYGGLAYAPTPDRATCAQQDAVAYRGWIDRWWQPWPTAA